MTENRELTGYLEFSELDPELYEMLKSKSYELKVVYGDHEIFKCNIIKVKAMDENTCMLVSEEGHYITVTNLLREGWIAKLRRVFRKLIRRMRR